MAFKNSMEVRKQMKLMRMFDQRDKLIVKHLQNISQILMATEICQGFQPQPDPTERADIAMAELIPSDIRYHFA
eukprot:CAMPEP_0168627154 /NCGR_PEP_ID=MMETSP0449_2-20121227/11063_1 /TAXON_ID=1082188 /ORGANISM="Strombidium rassoulzadegani, Strain ras09" /LENGTH=73 /DNA_ID=CAMNT_0008669295 /DNA_START=1 /DNA_END=219 /DNA_ORIENTATION=-